MPIKVGTTTIINDDNELENIADATGNYGNFHANVTDLGSGTTETLNFTGNPVYKKVMTADTTFNMQNVAAGRTIMLLLDTSTSNHTPTFTLNNLWAGDEEPNWADHQAWLITMVGWNTTSAFTSATGYEFD